MTADRPRTGLAIWMIVALAIQAVLFGLLALYGWGETYANGRGRHPSAADIVLVCAPLVLTVLCAVLAMLARRSGSDGAAVLAVVAPIPLAMLLLALSGAV